VDLEENYNNVFNNSNGKIIIEMDTVEINVTNGGFGFYLFANQIPYDNINKYGYYLTFDNYNGYKTDDLLGYIMVQYLDGTHNNYYFNTDDIVYISNNIIGDIENFNYIRFGFYPIRAQQEYAGETYQFTNVKLYEVDENINNDNLNKYVLNDDVVTKYDKEIITKTEIGYYPELEYIEIPDFESGNIISTGEFEARSSNVRSSQYIPVDPNTLYTIQCNDASYIMLAQYKSDYTFIKRAQYTVVNAINYFTLTTDSECAYAKIILSFPSNQTINNKIITDPILEKYDLKFYKGEYKEVKLNYCQRNELEGINNKLSNFLIASKSKNLWDDSLLFEQGHRNGGTNNGKFVSKANTDAQNNSAVREFIPVEPSTDYVFYYEYDEDLNYRVYIIQFDSNKTIVKNDFSGTDIARYNNQTNGIFQFTTFENTAYITFMTYLANNDDWTKIVPRNILIEKSKTFTGYIADKDVSDYVDPKTLYDRMQKADLLKSNSESNVEIPEYYFENDYLDNKISRINELIQNNISTGDCFAWISDMHYNRAGGHNSPKLLNYIYNNTYIRKLFNTGDDVDRARDATLCYSDIKKYFPGKYYHAMGNHEWFYTGGNEINEAFIMYSMDQNDEQDKVYGDAKYQYYYVNNYQQKIRYIMLNWFNPYYYDENDNLITPGGMTADQWSWLENVAMDVDDGWEIIIFSHAVLLTTGNGLGVISTSNSNTIKLWGIVDTFNSNNQNKKVIASFSGHTHSDGAWTSPGGVPFIIITEDNCVPWVDSQGNADLMGFDRTKGTITEQAFDIVVIDRTNKNIHLVRIGGPKHVTFDIDYVEESSEFVEEKIINYSAIYQ